MKFSERQGNLEVRSCSTKLTSTGEHTTAEIVMYAAHFSTRKEYCYTLAYWVRDSEGYSLRFIGNRPLEDDVSYTIFHYLAKYGQMQLDAYFDVFYRGKV